MDKVGQYSVEHQQRQVICISQDSFYKELTSEEKKKAAKGKYNFDHPGIFLSIIFHAFLILSCELFTESKIL